MQKRKKLLNAKEETPLRGDTKQSDATGNQLPLFFLSVFLLSFGGRDSLGASPVPWYLDLFVAFWFFFLGGCFGSFLNVVVYRLPRKMNLARPSSRCPHCSTKIRPWHNLPILGWLLLRGKCYDCQKPIAIRYPLVELTMAIAFLALAVFDLCSPGAAGSKRSIALSLVDPEWNRIGVYAIHCFLFSALLTLVLIMLDKRRASRSE